MRWLLEKGTVVIAAGGGGIPTVYEPGRVLRGIEASTRIFAPNF
jgi:carbamate kinase